MWERDRVFWGYGGALGTLLGSSRQRKGTINFREQIGVYVLYDLAMKPVYVGQAGRGNARLFDRLKNHSRGRLRQRWKYFSWFGLLSVNKSGRLSGWDKAEKRVFSTVGDSLNEIEAILIAAVEPPFNKQGSRFITTEQFQQEDDERLSESSNEHLADSQLSLHKKIDSLIEKKLVRLTKDLKAIRKRL
jgi:hypothetical protein